MLSFLTDLYRNWRMRRRMPPHLAAYAVDFARLRPSDIALDMGANVGQFTLLMALSGATVYAFEPNPHAFARLERNTHGFPNVTCLQKAVGVSAGQVPLYPHHRAGEDPLKWSTGSSLCPDKGNIDKDISIEVECIDLAAFVQGLERPVRLAKMDIEGLELDVIGHLLATRAMERISRLLVETHDAKMPALRPGMDRLRARASEPDLAGRIDFNWQ